MAKITNHNNFMGERHANKQKTEWYNEGERSNKYFLGILKILANQGKLMELVVNGQLTEDESEIENHVKTFYKDLYNQDRPEPSKIKTENVIKNLPRLDDIRKP